MPTEPLVAPASREAAKYAVESWHYSRVLPTAKLFVRGLWEPVSHPEAPFRGVAIFSRGSSPFLAGSWGLEQKECVELTRVALGPHATPVTQFVAEALRQLKAANPGLRMVVSFADPAQAHHGGIYQAGNWIYCGRSKSGGEYVIRGRQRHMRAVGKTYGTTNLPWIREHIDPNAYMVQPAEKYRYAMPLDRGARRLALARAETPPGPLDAPTPPALVAGRGVATAPLPG